MPSERVESFPELARLVGHELAVEVPAAALELLRGDRGFAHLEEADREAAIIFAALTHPAWRKAEQPEISPTAPQATRDRFANWVPQAWQSATNELAVGIWTLQKQLNSRARAGLTEWLWRAAVLLLLLGILASAAHCQNNSFLVQGLDGSGNVLGTFPSVLRLKPGSNCGIVIAGSVLTFNCAPINSTCEVAIGDPGSLSAPLANDNSSPAVCGNLQGVGLRITSVSCWADAGSPVVDVYLTGGASVLTGHLTCGTASWASGAISGTPVVNSFGSDGATCATAPCTLDANLVTAGGVAKYLVIRVGRSL